MAPERSDGCPERPGDPCVIGWHGTTCMHCGKPAGVHGRYRMATWYEAGCPCSKCERRGAEERYSLGIYAGRYCGACWRESGYRDEPASAFNPLDAGESYDPI